MNDFLQAYMQSVFASSVTSATQLQGIMRLDSGIGRSFHAGCLGPVDPTELTFSASLGRLTTSVKATLSR